VVAVLADVNIEGHVERIVRRMQSPEWLDFCQEIVPRYVTFAEVGLHRRSTDAEIWQKCQAEGLVLITNNRNRDGADSLEETIRTKNHLDALPVLTLSDADRVLESSIYLDRVVASAFEKLLDLDTRRGAGRLFLP
jgi:hypothetical protein